jgi:hypothetical protein
LKAPNKAAILNITKTTVILASRTRWVLVAAPFAENKPALAHH